MGNRADGTNPRNLGTNPRATVGSGGAASSDHPVGKAGQEVAAQIPCGHIFRTEGCAECSRWNWPQTATAASEKKLDLTDEQKLEAQRQEAFMALAAQARTHYGHDDDCAHLKGKECGCRDNLRLLKEKALPVLEEKKLEWNRVTFRKANMEELSRGERKPVAVMKRESATIVRVDDGKRVSKTIADPLSPRNPPITIWENLPPRWVCLDCAMSVRGTDVDHQCDDSVRAKAQRPVGLERSIPLETRFGGEYRLTFWRDRAGDYHIGEEVVKDGRVVDERHLYGPETYNVIEGALLDAAVSKLTP